MLMLMIVIIGLLMDGRPFSTNHHPLPSTTTTVTQQHHQQTTIVTMRHMNLSLIHRPLDPTLRMSQLEPILLIIATVAIVLVAALVAVPLLVVLALPAITNRKIGSETKCAEGRAR